MKRTRVFFLLSLLLLTLVARPAMAAATSPVVFGSKYWSDFIDHWQGVFQKQNGIAMGITLVGIVALFIITRGKWQK